MLIELDRICKSYSRNCVLDHLSATVEPGTLLCLLGINGAGKTTLLRMLAGVSGRDRGEILFDGKVACRNNISQRLNLCFLADFPVLFAEKTVLEQIAIYLKLWQIENPPPHDDVMNLLEELDLLKLGNKPIGSFSRGQVYKVALACMILVDPELWLIDEPFASGMDPQGITVFKKYAQEAVARGKTIIYTTQLLDLAEKFSSRIWVLNDGELAADGAPEQLVSENQSLEGLFARLREE